MVTCAGAYIGGLGGFGKARDGEYPAIYLIGKIGGTDGVYRSTDEGQIWRRINGPATQWGNLYHITGDPKTFGTVYIGTSGRGILYGTSPD